MGEAHRHCPAHGDQISQRVGCADRGCGCTDARLVRVAVSYTDSRVVFTCKGIISFYITEFGSLSSETDAPGGVVLDYALIKHMVDKHGGALAVDNEDGISVVTISLPLGSGHLPQGNLHHGPEIKCEVSRWEECEDDALEASDALDAPSMSAGSYGVDPSALDFEAGDAVLLVDGAFCYERR